MKRSIGAVLGTTVCILGTVSPTWADGAVRASGEFTVEIDFSTLALTPVDARCLIVVEGKADFSGTLDGIAFTRTRALAEAPCEEVAALPPGAFEDVFTSAFEFAGTVRGRAVVADLTYRGETALGGDIEAVLVPSNGLRGRLSVNATVAVGGTYRGFVRVSER